MGWIYLLREKGGECGWCWWARKGVDVLEIDFIDKLKSNVKI